MKRRDFITLLGGAAAWPLAVSAQQGERVRRIGVLAVTRETDPETPLRATAFRQALGKLGWSEGRNLVIDFRWGAREDVSHGRTTVKFPRREFLHPGAAALPAAIEYRSAEGHQDRLVGSGRGFDPQAQLAAGGNGFRPLVSHFKGLQRTRGYTHKSTHGRRVDFGVD
jgi:hypothetical protein